MAPGCLPDVSIVEDAGISHRVGMATVSFCARPGKSPQLCPTTESLEDAFAEPVPLLGCKAQGAILGALSADICAAFEDYR